MRRIPPLLSMMVKTVWMGVNPWSTNSPEEGRGVVSGGLVGSQWAQSRRTQAEWEAGWG